MCEFVCHSPFCVSESILCVTVQFVCHSPFCVSQSILCVTVHFHRQSSWHQWCTNPVRHDAVAAKFLTVAPNVLVGHGFGTCFMSPFWRLEFF